LILALLASGKAWIVETAEPFETSLPGVIEHVNLTECLNLITRGREVPLRSTGSRTSPLG